MIKREERRLSRRGRSTALCWCPRSLSSVQISFAVLKVERRALKNGVSPCIFPGRKDYTSVRTDICKYVLTVFIQMCIDNALHAEMFVVRRAKKKEKRVLQLFGNLRFFSAFFFFLFLSHSLFLLFHFNNVHIHCLFSPLY